MKIIDPSYEILTDLNGEEILKRIELCGRVCYKSEDKIDSESSRAFVNMICNVHKHESVLEHFSFSVRFINDRGFTHELVRHRIASFSQESQRYVNYSKDKHGNEITFINPTWFEGNDYMMDIWKKSMLQCEMSYLDMIKNGAKPEQARGVLPNDTKTEIIISANLREWKHILTLRCSKQAHPTMQRVMRPLLKDLQNRIPVIFDNITF